MPHVRARTAILSRWMLKKNHTGHPLTSYTLGLLEIGNISDAPFDLTGYGIRIENGPLSPLIFGQDDDKVIMPGGNKPCEAMHTTLQHGQGLVSLVDANGKTVHRLHLSIMTLPGGAGFESKIRSEEFAPDAYEQLYVQAPGESGMRGRGKRDSRVFP